MAENPLATAFQRAAALAEYHSPQPRQPFERIGVYPVDGVYPVQGNSPHGGTWRAVWQRGYLPTPGAMDMAYMSLGLAAYSPCGPGFDVQGPGFRCFQPPPAYAPQAIGVQGMGTFHGQVFTAPLSVPDAYTSPAKSKGV